MGVWEFFRRKKDKEEKAEISNLDKIRGAQAFGEPKVEKNPYFSDNIPTPEQIDAVQMNVNIDVSKLILSSSILDHRIGSMILSNIFLIPRNMKRAEDSWPLYHDNILMHKKIQIELMERKAREDLINLKGKGKKIKNEFYQLIKEKRELMQNYYEEYEKTLSLSIQKIRVEIIPIEKEITELKYKLSDVKQKINLNRQMQLEKIKEYNQLLDSNVKLLTKIKDAVKNILSLKKLWQAAHIVASYIVAFFGATELVKGEQFRQFVREKIQKFSFISDFVNANFVIVQAISAALIFLVTIGMYDKFVIDYLKRRAVKKELNELMKKEKEYQEEIERIEKRILYLKEERNKKVKAEIKEAEDVLELLYEDYKSNMSVIDSKLYKLFKDL